MEKKESGLIKKMSIMELIENVVESTNDHGIELDDIANAYIVELAKRLGLTPEQAMLTSVFVDQSDDTRITNKDLARHFGVRPVKMLGMRDVIDSLVKLAVICKRVNSDGDITYRMPNSVIECLRKGVLPTRESLEGLTAREWFDQIDCLLKKRDKEEITDNDLHSEIQELIALNPQLYICDRLKAFKFNDNDVVLLLLLCNIYINDHDEHIMRCDIDDYFSRSVLRHHTTELDAGTHVLMTNRLVEYACTDGQVDSEAWHITNYCKMDFLQELNIKVTREFRANLTHHESIAEKAMFYNESVTQQVNELRDLLGRDRMERVQKRLKNKGMRTGFTCLFYGAPGTGKTETVQQLARITGRDIMLVDVPNVRSKWVGETEKNIKGIFDRYRHIAEQTECAPILLFNEADAVLNKRSEGATGSVDKMENAMQNIILQEMEQLDGIMIATTNLTGSLDGAFERRFLYKIQFDKPTPKESMHIWKAMLPELNDDDALYLAENYSFSGGQIENIARKQTITAILSDDDTLSIERIHESCRQESLKNSNKVKIGFV